MGTPGEEGFQDLHPVQESSNVFDFERDVEADQDGELEDSLAGVFP